MGDGTRFDVENMICCGNDLIKLLEADKDINTLKHCLQQFQMLQSQCDGDFKQAQCSMQEYERKLDSSRRKIAETKLEHVEDHTESEVQELEEVSQREHLLRDELRVMAAVIDNLDQQSRLVDEQRLAPRKIEQEDMKKEQVKSMRILSMYASATNIIPNLDDQSKISCHIMNKKVVQRCEFDPAKDTPFDTCNSIWKMID